MALTQIPTGFHGDEAVSGLEAQRISRQNGIGRDTQAALGQPTGPIYAVALSIRAFGDTVFSVRLVSVIAGLLTISVLYGLARRFFDAKVALLAAFYCLASTGICTFRALVFRWQLGRFLCCWVLDFARSHHAPPRFLVGAIGRCFVQRHLYLQRAHLIFGDCVRLCRLVPVAR